MVRLAEHDVEAPGGGGVLRYLLDVGEGFPPVDFRLALAEQVEIGPVEDVYPRIACQTASGSYVTGVASLFVWPGDFGLWY